MSIQIKNFVNTTKIHIHINWRKS